MQDSTALKCSLASPIHSTPGRQQLQSQLQRQLLAKPLLSQPTMERRAEINGFAIFLFCLLVPLGSLAPTEMSESKMTSGHRQKRFTTKIPQLAAVIGVQARELFEFYQNCLSGTLHSRHETLRSNAKDLADRIPECPAFQADCCALRHIYNILQTLESDIETICTENATKVITANRNQLNITLSEGEAFYTCKTDNPPQTQSMGEADKINYTWAVLKKYERIMQITNSLYSEAKA